MLGNPDSKPHFFSDKALEPTIKAIVRKFPLMDTKSSSVSLVIDMLLMLLYMIIQIRHFCQFSYSSTWKVQEICSKG